MQLYFTYFIYMKQLLIVLPLVFLASCTPPWQDKYEHPNLSGEVPPEAKTIEGYDYPAVPLDEFNKNQQ